MEIYLNLAQNNYFYNNNNIKIFVSQRIASKVFKQIWYIFIMFSHMWNVHSQIFNSLQWAGLKLKIA